MSHALRKPGIVEQVEKRLQARQPCSSNDLRAEAIICVLPAVAAGRAPAWTGPSAAVDGPATFARQHHQKMRRSVCTPFASVT